MDYPIYLRHAYAFVKVESEHRCIEVSEYPQDKGISIKLFPTNHIVEQGREIEKSVFNNALQDALSKLTELVKNETCTPMALPLPKIVNDTEWQ